MIAEDCQDKAYVTWPASYWKTSWQWCRHNEVNVTNIVNIVT